MFKNIYFNLKIRKDAEFITESFTEIFTEKWLLILSILLTFFRVHISGSKQ